MSFDEANWYVVFVWCAAITHRFSEPPICPPLVKRRIFFVVATRGQSGTCKSAVSAAKPLGVLHVVVVFTRILAVICAKVRQLRHIDLSRSGGI